MIIAYNEVLQELHPNTDWIMHVDVKFLYYNLIVLRFNTVFTFLKGKIEWAHTSKIWFLFYIYISIFQLIITWDNFTRANKDNFSIVLFFKPF